MTSLPLLISLAFAPAENPGAFALLEQARRSYAALEAYADSGEVAVETANGESRYRFETRYRPAGASYLLERLGAESPLVPEPPAVWAVWRDASGLFLYDGGSDSYRQVESAGAALTELLGAERLAAALVALELLAQTSPLESPIAASVEGTAACGTARCFRIDVTTEDGRALRVLLDRETGLVRGAEATIDPIDALAGAAGADRETRARVARAARAAGATRIVARFEPVVGEAAAAAPFFRPPPSARAAGAGTLADGPGASKSAADAGSLADARGPDAPAAVNTADAADVDAPPLPPRGRVFAEEIEVRIRTLAVRVVDVGGRPIRDLVPEDFEVRVGGIPARVESVDWIDGRGERFTPEEMVELARSGVTVPAGRLVVVFVQADAHPSRAPGHLRLLPELRKLLATFGPEDEVAVVSFDSHLKLRQDFTRDVARVEDGIVRSVVHRRPPEEEPARYPSLRRHFDARAARRAASPERALRVVAEALLPLPGEKVMIFAGWGLGDYVAGSVVMPPAYDEAREALARARVTVFVLDVTQADYHSLEAGLETVAYDTGGTYEKTFRWPGQMTERLARTLEGHYEISFAVPAGIARPGKVTVDLVGRRGQVLVRPTRAGG